MLLVDRLGIGSLKGLTEQNKNIQFIQSQVEEIARDVTGKEAA
jgi:hypothetical protein